MLRKKFHIPIGILIVAICAIGFLSLRSDVPEKPIQIYKATLTETPATDETAETETAETETAETQTHPSCCENGDALCCQTPGSSCCPPLFQQSAEVTTSLSVDTSDVGITEDTSNPLSEGIVVPESVVAEANRFREWSEMQEAHGKARAEHDSKDEQLAVDLRKSFAAWLMTLPIERREALFEDMKRQFMESGVPEAWDAYEAGLYSAGLDFQTEYSPEKAEAESHRILGQMGRITDNMLETSQEGQKLLDIQKKLDAESDTF